MYKSCVEEDKHAEEMEWLQRLKVNQKSMLLWRPREESVSKGRQRLILSKFAELSRGMRLRKCHWIL